MNTYTRIQSFVLAAVLIFLPKLANADWVGESQTTKFLEQSTINLLAARMQTGGGGFQVGDEISYIIQFTPVPGGGKETVGAGAYVTDYIPVGTEVVNAEFVQLGANGNYTRIAPPPPAQVLSPFVPMYSETGIFYSTDPRTSYYSTPTGAPISTSPAPGNGYVLPAGVAALPKTSTHNFWDLQMATTYAAAARPAAVAGCAAPAVALTVGSPVAGPDALMKNDYTLGQGPWQRVSYSGSTFGTLTGVAGPNLGCIGGTPTLAGWSLSRLNPLPSGTNALRFIGGQVAVGQLFSVRVTLRLTQAIPQNGLINNSEVFGGDASLAGAKLIGKDNMWKYHAPSAANNNTSLAVIKQVIGMCAPVAPATTCVPQPFSGGAVPSVANLILRYQVTYMNTSAATQNNVSLSDILPVGGVLVPASATVVSGLNILPTVAGVGGFSFQPIASLGSGSGGVVNFDVSFAAAPLTTAAIANTAKLSSLQVPLGVTSVAVVTPTITANLNLGKTTSTSTVAPGGVVNYSITVPNNGGAAASGITVTDTLPSAGGTLPAQRFSYLAGATTTATITSPPVAPATLPTITPVVVTASVPVVATLAPYTGQNREQVIFSLPVGTVLPSGSTLTINFSAVAGASVPSAVNPYLNDAQVSYGGGAAPAPGFTTLAVQGVAPVRVTLPLSLSKSIECVYSGLVCQPYTNGTIPTVSKVRYRLSYSNTSASALTGVVLSDTLPANTSYILATSTQNGTPIVDPAVVAAGVPVRQTLTFGAVASIPANSAGFVSFDVQLGTALQIPSGSTITNDANVSSTLYPGGAQASLTSSVRDAANLVVTKTTSTPTLSVNGVATYTINVANTGNTPATGIIIYDYLPFVGTVANPNTRFNYGATAVFVPPAAPSTLTAPTVVASLGAAANLPPNSKNPNQQQVVWTFVPAQALAPGASFSLTFTATAGAAGGLPAGSTVYSNDVFAQYTSGLTALSAGVAQTAPVTIPSNLLVNKTIDCVYNAALTSCNAYNGSGIIPVNAKVRYKLTYQNTAATAQTNVTICDRITSNQAVALTATVTTPTVAPTPTGPFTNLPALAAPTILTAAASIAAPCSFPALVAPTTGVAFSFPVIASLAAGASGVVYYDVTTNAASGATIQNTGKLVSTQAPAGEVSIVTSSALSVPSLSISKTTTTPVLTANGTATYTISVTNTGSGPTTGLKIYDYLPYNGVLLDPTRRFNYVATTGYTKATTLAPTPVAFVPTTPIITPVVAPTVAPYNANINQQQVLWDFGTAAANQLAPGDTLTITFTATVGSAMPLGSYGNSVGYEFASAGGPGSNNVNGLAPVAVMSALTVSKKIIALCSGVGCTPTAYTPGTLIPPNALIRYQIDYSNPDVTNAHTNVVLSDVLPIQTAAAPVSNVVIVSGAITAPPAPTLAGLAAGGATLTFPTLASLPAAATGTITLDVQTNAALGVTVNNTANVVSTQGTTAVTSTASATVTDLEVIKTIVGVCSGAACTPTAYTPGALIPANAKIRYQLAYRNASATIAQTNVVLSDVLPVQTAAAAVSNVVIVNGAITAPAAATLSALAAGGATLTFPTLASLPANASGTIRLDVQTNAGVASKVSNTARLLSTQDAIGVSSTVTASTPNLLLSKTLIGVCAGAACTPTAYTPGSVIPPNAKLRYQLSYSNASTVAAQTNVVLSDVLPAQTAAASVSNVIIVSGPITAPNAATLSALAAGGATLSFPTLANLAANTGGVITLDVQTNATAGVTVSNTAKLVSAEDTTGQSSTASADVTNLVISKTTSTAQTLQGGLATYTITITNASTVSADTLQVYDFLPFNGTAVDANQRFSLVVGSSAYTGGLPTATVPSTAVAPTLAPYSANTNEQEVLWDFGTFVLGAGASATITFNAAVGSAMPLGNYTNSATVNYKVAGVAKSSSIDATATVQIVAKPTINLSKVVKAYSDPVHGLTTPAFLPGGLLEYTVTASNAGGSADGIVIEDFVPPNTTLYVRDLGVVGSGPIIFTPGVSGLSYQFLGLSNLVDDVEFFNGTVWTAVPAPGADGCDPTITKIRVKPTGVFAGNATTPPSFSVSFRACLQ